MSCKMIVNFTFLILTLFLSACATPQARPLTRENVDISVFGTDVLGITMGMTPRRVLIEATKNSWELDKLSDITLEDMIDNKLTRGSFYFNTFKPSKARLELSFQDNRVYWARKTTQIPEEALLHSLSAARAHLKSLGNFKEVVEKNGYKLIYQKQDMQYVSYDFYKVVKEQEGYYVWFSVVMAPVLTKDKN